MRTPSTTTTPATFWNGPAWGEGREGMAYFQHRLVSSSREHIVSARNYIISTGIPIGGVGLGAVPNIGFSGYQNHNRPLAVLWELDSVK